MCQLTMRYGARSQRKGRRFGKDRYCRRGREVKEREKETEERYRKRRNLYKPLSDDKITRSTITEKS